MGSARDFLEESYGEWTLDFVVGLVLDSDKIASFLARWWKSTKKPWHAEQAHLKLQRGWLTPMPLIIIKGDMYI